jgi:nucleoside-diphosphate-sugar epimerase
MGKTHLVTGATGFIGHHLVETLLSGGESVRILVRDRRKIPARWQERVEVIEGDLAVALSLKEAVRNCDEVYHLAGVINLPAGQERDFYRINLDGTKNIFKAVIEENPGIKRFLYCSSVGVLGPLKVLPANEKTPCNPSNDYEKSKLAAERWVLEEANHHDIPVCVVRPAWVYGPGDRRTFPIFSMIAKKRFIMIGKGSTWIHPVFVADLARGMIQCSRTPEAVGKTVILAGKQPIRLRDLANQLSRILGVKLWPFYIPINVARLIAIGLEILYKPMRKMPPLHRRRLEFFLRNQSFDTMSAKTCCKFSPKTGLEEGMGLTADWYKKHGWI